jgi:peptidoglycan/xylan/chitin deacetylase (PgdA/CDA1 family)
VNANSFSRFFVHTFFDPRMVPPSLRQLAKSFIDHVGAILPRKIPGGASLILCYHNVVADEEAGHGDTSLHLPATQFARQLAIAAAEGDLVSLPELLEAHGTRGRRIAITFDDAYRGCLRLGIPLCTNAGVWPTVFVAPALLGTFAPWDVASLHGRWSMSERLHFLEAGGTATENDRRATTNGLPADYGIVTGEELTEFAAAHAFHLANHTLHHVNLARTGMVPALDEINECEQFLVRHYPQRLVPQCLAYPYGLPPDAETSAALASQVRHGLRVSGGWLHPREQARGLSLPRLNVPAGLSPARFRTQLRGWFV